MTSLARSAQSPECWNRISLRDPAGVLYRFDGRLLRAVRAEMAPAIEAVLRSEPVQALWQQGRCVPTRWIEGEEKAQLSAALVASGEWSEPPGLWLEHQPVRFVSYPTEWPTGMLLEAARTTLDLADGLLDSGLGLKDATPYNILFEGTRPVFVDILSFEPRAATDPIWLAFGQFLRLFAYPLLARKFCGIDAGLDGMDAAALLRVAGSWRSLRPLFFSHVTFPAWLERLATGNPATYRPRRSVSPESARFTLHFQLRRLGRLLDRIAVLPDRTSHWASYTAQCPTYSPEEWALKSRLVERALSELRPRSVLDVGCNTGHFSRIAARLGAQVVGIDADGAAAERAWHENCASGLDVQTLVVSLARPTPALGWRNAETRAFLERARGGFDTVLALAVLHHLVIGDGISLEDAVRQLAELTRHTLVIEFVGPDDDGARRLARGRALRELERSRFEQVVGDEFVIERSTRLGQRDRYLYVLRRRADRVRE